jgi:DNA polymerase/3'-5' exonuclease PolX
MKNQKTIQSATITLAIDDLQLLQEALNALQLRRVGVGYGKKDDINRLYHAISLVIYDDVCSSNSESAIMSS